MEELIPLKQDIKESVFGAIDGKWKYGEERWRSSPLSTYFKISKVMNI